MEITPFYEPDSGTWTYLLAEETALVAAIIDPVLVFDPVSGMADTAFVNRVLDLANKKGYRVDWVLETHAHADHLTAAHLIRQRTSAKIACGKGIRSVQQTFAKVFNLPKLATDGSQFDRLLSEGDVIQLGVLEIRVMETPGHTGDSVTYLAGDAAFIGDTLFAPAFGTARCDFPGGNAGQLYDSIQQIHALPGSTRLYLCHDYPKQDEKPISQITVEQSRTENIHITMTTRKSDFVTMRTGRDAELDLPRLILPSLQVNIRAGAAPPPENNGATYLKTPFNHPLADLITR